MSVYRPSYIDHGEKKQQTIWWYSFVFQGQRIQKSSGSTRKTIAVEAEKKRRLELEKGFNGIEDTRADRIRTIQEIGDAFLTDYRMRHPQSATFADYALRHVSRLVGRHMSFEVTETVVKGYQSSRMKEKASPKTINEEVGFLLRTLGDHGDIIRLRLKKQKALKLKIGRQVARAFSPDEKAAMLAEAKVRRSPSIYPALMLALHVGLRDAELRGLQWSQIDLSGAVLTVGDSKTEAGEGRTVPLNRDVLQALIDHARWYLGKFGETRPEWFIFPGGKPQPTHPEKPCTSFKTVWAAVKEKAGVSGRWHDNRHTWVTDLAESGKASDETIRDLAGHVSKQMLKHYSHIRMEAKKNAVRALERENHPVSVEVSKDSTKVDVPSVESQIVTH